MRMTRQPSLQQLRYAVTLADKKNFNEAASLCCVAPSSFSNGIKELEEALGVALFERTTRKVMVTPIGERLVARAREILHAVQYLMLEAEQGRGHLTRLQLGSIPTILPYLMPSFVPRLRTKFPDIALELIEDQTEALLSLLDRGILDVLLLALPANTNGLVVQELYSDPLILVVPKGHRLEYKNALSVEDVAAEELLMLGDGHCLSEHTLEACGLQRYDLRGVSRASTLNALINMVAQGLGVALIPQMCLGRELISDDVSILHFEGDNRPQREIALAWRASSPKGRALHSIQDCFME